jgi:hypothetical protein
MTPDREPPRAPRQSVWVAWYANGSAATFAVDLSEEEAKKVAVDLAIEERRGPVVRLFRQ